MSMYPHYIMSKQERQAAWGLIHGASLGAAIFATPKIIHVIHAHKIKETSSAILDIEQQLGYSPNNSALLIAENTADIENSGGITTTPPVKMDTLSTAVHAESLAPLYQKHADLQNGPSTGTVGLGIAAGLVAAYLGNALSMYLGADYLYEKGGIALAKMLPKKKQTIRR